MPKPRPLQVLLAVFDSAACITLRDHLRRLGCVCETAESLERTRLLLRERPPDLAIFETGRHAIPLAQLTRLAGETPSIALAAPHPDSYFQAARSGVEAVIALPLNALDYVPKLDAIRLQIFARHSASSSDTLSPTPVQLDPVPPQPAHANHIPSLFASSDDMAEVRELIEKVAPTSATVLLRGESGVGKELAARLIHSRSLRNIRPFIKVNCAAIPNELLESELFGYEAGAFTGAAKDKPGKFELADEGTIFLDEIGELHPVLQAKLLHVLQDGQFTRLGAKRDTAVDVRVICATNRMLDVLVANGEFREDLFYRINVVTVSVPPLRSRTREIPVLIDFFLRRYALIYGKPLLPLGDEHIRALTAYSWPGNIRELENVCKRYVIVGNMEQIIRELEQRSERPRPGIPPRAAAPPETPAASQQSNLTLLEIGKRAAWAAERTAIASTLEATRWNRREAARRLGVSYKALLNKIALLKMESEVHEMVKK